MAFNFGDIPLILQELRRYFASKAQGTLADSALQPGAIGSTVQAYDADLAAVAAITTTGGIKRTGANTWTTFPLTNAGEAVTGAADAAAQRTALGLTIGSNVQAWDADLDAIAAISTTGPIERTGAGTWAVSDRVRLFGGNARGTNTDFSTTGNVTLSEGTYFYRNLTINAGHTVTVNKFARIHCTGTVTINGKITVTTAAPGGVGLFYVNSPIGALGGEPGFGIGGQRPAAAGSAYGLAGTSYPPSAQLFGSGGTAGYINGTGQNDLRAGYGGDGGGGLIIEAAGAIALTQNESNPCIAADGGNGTNGAVTGTTGSTGAATGGGGGSGGLVSLSSLATITLDQNGYTGTAIITVRGGNGGTGARTAEASWPLSGGGGGGGGWIFLTAPTINYQGGATISANGGTGGSGSGPGGSPGGGFGAGYGGNGGTNGGGATAGTTGSTGIVIQRTWKEVA